MKSQWAIRTQWHEVCVCGVVQGCFGLLGCALGVGPPTVQQLQAWVTMLVCVRVRGDNSGALCAIRTIRLLAQVGARKKQRLHVLHCPEQLTTKCNLHLQKWREPVAWEEFESG